MAQVKSPASHVLTPERASFALTSALQFIWSSQVGRIIASIRSAKPLERPTGYAIGQPFISGSGNARTIVGFNFWLRTSDATVTQLILDGLLGAYFDGIWLGGYLFETPFIDATPVLSAARHQTLTDRFDFEMLSRVFRQNKHRKSGVWKSRIQVRKDGKVTLPFQEQVVRRIPVR